MELVIKITKKLYDRYKKTDHIKICELDEFEKALDKCIILPKGHGRLIDADRVIAEATERMKYPANHQYTECVIAHMHLAPTIIEADKAESE